MHPCDRNSGKPDSANSAARFGIEPTVSKAPHHPDELSADHNPADESTDDPHVASGVRRGRPSVAEAEALSGKILDASWEVLLTAGFENFTFDRVARHAHIGKATIYSRFAGKAELMEALLRHRIGRKANMIEQPGSEYTIEEAFCIKAANTIKMLFSPDGVLLERLIDWLDQEAGDHHPNMRGMAYRNAIETITRSLETGLRGSGIIVADVAQTARFWLEGLIGHARLAGTEGASSPSEIERWAQAYSRFFFAGLRATSVPG